MIAILDINMGENIPVSNISSTTTYCAPFNFGDGTWGVIKDEVTEKYLLGETVEYTPPVDEFI